MIPTRLLAGVPALAALVMAAPEEASAQAQCTGPASPIRLYVNVQNVRSAQGLIAVTLYADDSRRFLARRGSLYVGRAPARAGTTRVCIHLPATGVWGLAVYHDADGNRTFNRNSLGLPAEGFGFSNNAPAIFGLPSFRRVRLSVPRNNMQTSVRLRYP
ncbi:MAG TPA: DUF2141 domain-containing protein [Allosphingosinicella sp.]|nr:DUF2141 domain-containing protein [Allosphingosinicella sp.]